MDLSDCDEMLGEKEFIHLFSKYLSVPTVCEAVVGSNLCGLRICETIVVRSVCNLSQ